MTDSQQKHPRRTRWLARGLIVALIALAVIYLRCGGGGLGFGGGGGGGSNPLGLLKETPPPTTPASKDGEAPAAGKEPLRCQLRLDSGGLWLLGATGQAQTDIAAAVASCKEAGGADVVVTGEARQGAWDELRAALDSAGIRSFVRGGGAPTTPTTPTTTGTPAAAAPAGAQTAPVAPAGATGEPASEASGGSNAR
jgi:hypothetical protein